MAMGVGRGVVFDRVVKVDFTESGKKREPNVQKARALTKEVSTSTYDSEHGRSMAKTALARSSRGKDHHFGGNRLCVNHVLHTYLRQNTKIPLVVILIFKM